jgi:hypothetical protein
LIAGVIFIAILGLSLFLLLPVMSIAGDAPNKKTKGWTYLFLILVGFIPLWLVKGFSFARSVLKGEAFQADYWGGVWDFSFSIAGVGNTVWVAISWLFYLLGLIVLGFLALMMLGEAMKNTYPENSRKEKLLKFAAFGVIAYLGYLWGSSGKEWLISWFI